MHPARGILLVMFAATLIVAGCSLQSELDSELPLGLAKGPDGAAATVVSDKAAQAIDAAGGMATWSRLKQLMLDGVVTVPQPDGSYYLTEHRHQIYPWSRAIRVTAHEPSGTFVWQLVDGRFTVEQGSGGTHVAELGLSYRDYADAILRLLTVPAGLVDRSVNTAELPGLVNIKGVRYGMLEQTPHPLAAPSVTQAGEIPVPPKPRWSKVVLFQNQDSLLVDLIRLDDSTRQTHLTVQGYDYDRLRDSGVQVPKRIEIHRTDPASVSRSLLVQIDLR